MALNPSQQWWIRIAGNELNGGGFDDEISSPGTNRADSDSAHVTFNGTSVTAITAGVGATITITGYTVLTADVANTLRIASGTNYVTGYYTIVSVNTGANTWTLDRNVTSGAGAALVGRMGGAHAGFINYSSGGGGSSPALATPLIAGNIINIRGTTATPSAADYTQTSFYTFPSGDTTDGIIRVKGYNGRPGLTGTDHLMFFNLGGWKFESVAFIATTGSGFSSTGFLNGGGDPAVWLADCYFDQAGFDVALATDLANLNACTCVNTGSTAAGTNPTVTLVGEGNLIHASVFLDQRGSAILQTAGLGTMTDCIVARCATSDGAVHIDSTTQHRSLKLINCTIVDNAGDGVSFTTMGAVMTSCVLNSVISGNGGWGLNYSFGALASNNRINVTRSNYNAFFGNSSGAQTGLVSGANDVTLSGDPLTNGAGDDFSLNNTAGAGAACREAAFPGAFMATATTGYLDIGAVQHQGGGGGGTTFIGIIGGT